MTAEKKELYDVTKWAALCNHTILTHAVERQISDFIQSECLRNRKESAREALEAIKAIPNPYPEDIFVEPTHEQFQKFNKYLEQFGLAPDAYNGSMGRRTWENFKAKIDAYLADLDGGKKESEG